MFMNCGMPTSFFPRSSFASRRRDRSMNFAAIKYVFILSQSWVTGPQCNTQEDLVYSRQIWNYMVSWRIANRPITNCLWKSAQFRNRKLNSLAWILATEVLRLLGNVHRPNRQISYSVTKRVAKRMHCHMQERKRHCSIRVWCSDHGEGHVSECL